MLACRVFELLHPRFFSLSAVGGLHLTPAESILGTRPRRCVSCIPDVPSGRVARPLRRGSAMPRPGGEPRPARSRLLVFHRPNSFGGTLLRAQNDNCARLTPVFPYTCKLTPQGDARLTPLFSISFALFFTLSNLLSLANHLFSSNCALFWKNTRGGGTSQELTPAADVSRGRTWSPNRWTDIMHGAKRLRCSSRL